MFLKIKPMQTNSYVRKEIFKLWVKFSYVNPFNSFGKLFSNEANSVLLFSNGKNPNRNITMVATWIKTR